MGRGAAAGVGASLLRPKHGRWMASALAWVRGESAAVSRNESGGWSTSGRPRRLRAGGVSEAAWPRRP